MEEYIVSSKKVLVNTFESLRDSSDAYFLGYLMCDGGYQKPTHKRKHRIAVSSTDIYIIDYFVEHYQPLSDPMLRKPHDNLKAGIVGKKQYKNFVLSSKFSESLGKFGVMCKKEDRIYQGVSNKLFPAFLLGAFDADGCISFGERSDRNRMWAFVSFTHSSLGFLTKIQKHLHEQYGISSFVNPKSKENCFVLRVCNMEGCKKMYEVLYSLDTPVYNKRKKQIFENFITELDSRMPPNRVKIGKLKD